ncbi:bile acid:sodium symporter family protein [Acinetobacter chinensis]|uniref:bile acid:sodium symporter family protein n=1 Tax=Acinetobacter chinensis TaxID=2004650 RepID=UPI002934B7D4|nr:bile acid:sodium symporter family protein [Acinetobacter chinensis]WOE42350.1 bile acid:sodium symporter family protein [Acinetobacter chinensis]
MGQLGIITVLLPAALAIIMIGLGLELTAKDFLRVSKHPKAILVALFAQLVVLVFIAFLICKVLALPPLLAIGLMLLSATPGGPTANLYSYLFKGDVALNISLTAINSVLAAFTLPLIANFAIQHFSQDQQVIGLQFGKIIQVFFIILVPVMIGMSIRQMAPKVAHHLEKPVKIFSVIFLICIVSGAIFMERKNLAEYITQVGLASGLFCFSALVVGYCIPRLFKINSYQARACAFEIGLHNSTLAMTIALTVLMNATIAMPAAVYSLFMYIFSFIFGMLINHYQPLQHPNRLPQEEA